MKTLADTSTALREALTSSELTQAGLKARAGISQRTLTNVLSGEQDFKLSTLLAVADRLGLEMLLVPKGAVAAFGEFVGSNEVTEPAVKSRVQAAMERIGGRT
jgi:transcriptional regulator with XRE-family HTH domain